MSMTEIHVRRSLEFNDAVLSSYLTSEGELSYNPDNSTPNAPPCTTVTDLEFNFLKICT